MQVMMTTRGGGVHYTRLTKCTNLFLRYLYFNITLNSTTCFGPEGTIITPVLTFVNYVG